MESDALHSSKMQKKRAGNYKPDKRGSAPYYGVLLPDKWKASIGLFVVACTKKHHANTEKEKGHGSKQAEPILRLLDNDVNEQHDRHNNEKKADYKTKLGEFFVHALTFRRK